MSDSYTKKRGPNEMRVVMMFASKRAIPDGGSFMNGLTWLKDREQRKTDIIAACADTDAAIAAVKSAPDNPYKTDEEICEAIVTEYNKRARFPFPPLPAQSEQQKGTNT